MAETLAGPAAAEDPVEADEYHSTPVPLSARLGFGQPAWVWSGFGIAFICAVIGGTIQQGLGTLLAIAAIILGNIILFIYSAALGYASGKWGLNFPLTVKAVFGVQGAKLPIIVLALLVTGWYSFHVWLTADIIGVAFDLDARLVVAGIALVVGVIYAIPVIFGIRSMALVRQIAIPAMVLFVIYYIITRVIPAGATIFEAQGSGDISFLTGVGMAWATFAVSGTMTGDIVRYTRTGGQAVGVTGVAFLFSNGPFMIMGALFAAAINDPTVPYFLDAEAMTVLIPLAAIAILSTWSTADACLYNASLGFANTSPRFTWRSAAMLGMIIGLVGATTGVVGNVTNLLLVIGLVVPPIGGAIIADYYLVRRRDGFGVLRTNEWNIAAIIASTVGIAVGWYVYTAFPDFLFGVPGIVVSMAVYAVLASTARDRVGADLSAAPSGAEAEGYVAVST